MLNWWGLILCVSVTADSVSTYRDWLLLSCSWVWKAWCGLSMPVLLTTTSASVTVTHRATPHTSEFVVPSIGPSLTLTDALTCSRAFLSVAYTSDLLIWWLLLKHTGNSHQKRGAYRVSQISPWYRVCGIRRRIAGQLDHGSSRGLAGCTVKLQICGIQGQVTAQQDIGSNCGSLWLAV